jgi:hypothetical protein
MDVGIPVIVIVVTVTTLTTTTTTNVLIQTVHIVFRHSLQKRISDTRYGPALCL